MATLAHHLNKIRQKPDHIKRHIAFWTSLCLTLVIVLFWVASFSFGGSATVAAASSVESPLHAVTASAGDAWASFTSIFGASTATYKAPPLQVSAGK